VTDEDLDNLVELSEVDASIARLAATLADLPEQHAVVEAEGRRRALVEEGDALRVDIERANAEQRRHERDIDQLKQRLGAEQQRLYGGEITNAKEMQSVEAEIAATQTRVDDHETGLLEAMEHAESLEGQAEERARGVEQTTAEIAELEAARDTAAATILAERAELEVQRDGVREQLSAEPTARYDKVRERVAAGMAVGELSGSACTACRIDLPRAELNELRDGPPLTTCPNCRRLLVVR
jgi:hypothetical protein